MTVDAREWHEQLADTLGRLRWRLRLADWAWVVLVAALVCGLARAADTTDSQMAWAFPTVAVGIAAAGVGGLAGLFAAVWLGRLATWLHVRGGPMGGLVGAMARMVSALIELVAFGIIMAVTFEVMLFMAWSLLALALTLNGRRP